MDKAKIERTLTNFYGVPAWNTTMTGEEIDYLFLNYDSLVICNGRARRIKADPITNNVFKVYTVRA